MLPELTTAEIENRNAVIRAPHRGHTSRLTTVLSGG